MTESERRIQLLPKRPPGRGTRKARSFASEIERLRAEGYTCEAIREALAAAGVQVSKSTVQREAARTRSKSLATQASDLSVVRTAPPTSANAVDVAPPADFGVPASPPAPLRGKAIAQTFMQGRITNPLLRKETHK
jgi:predicted DNA-binding protein (UPF0251 family)